MYGGDSAFSGSSAVVTENVQQSVSNTSLSVNFPTSSPGQSVTFTATVYGTAGVAPTGSVNFYDGGTPIGGGTLVAGGTGAVASLTTSTLGPGAHSITAAFSGDINYSGSTSSAVGETVSQPTSPTTVGLSSSSATVTAGQSVTFTAAVSGPGGTPTGSVTFLDGSTPIGAAILSSGVASLSTSTLAVGSHSITAVYGGDTSHGGATSQPLAQAVQQAGAGAATVALSSSAQGTTVGQSLSLSALVSPPPGGATPAGSVTFLDNGSPVATVALSAYMGTTMRAVYATAGLPVGSHSITACYNGGGGYGAATSAATPVTVQRGSVLLMESTGSNSNAYGAAVTFTATIEYAQGPPPTGVISFFDGSTLLGTANVGLVNGYYVATFTTAALGRGAHNIVASYGGDQDYNSASASLSQYVY